MSKLARVIVVRHCQDISSHELSKTGLQQATNLGSQIKALLEGENPNGVVILSSPPGRAFSTANRIGEWLGVSPQIVDALELDYFHHGKSQIEAIADHLERNAVVVVVTHFEAPSGIIDALLQKHFGKRFESEEIPKGTGFVFDRQTGQVSRISGHS